MAAGVAAVIELAHGRTLSDGRYRLERRLGAGGMASVWRATDERLGRPVAVKVLADTLAGDEGYVARFHREARIAAGLSHPHLVHVFDFGTEEGRSYLVMELVQGRTLGERLRDSAPIDLDPTVLAYELLDALGHVHAAGIVHRDVKPANVLIGDDGRARISDFGIAQPQDATRLTNTGLVVGTMRYLAPEVLAGGTASVASDLFALGRLLEEVVAHELVPDGEPLHMLITHLTEEAPEQRPATAREAAALLAPSSTAVTLAGRESGKRRGTDRGAKRATGVAGAGGRAGATGTGATAATGVLPARRDTVRPRRGLRVRPGRGAVRRSRSRSPWQSTALSLPALPPRLRGVLIAVVVSAAIIGAIALARSGGGTPSPTSSAPPASASLARQLDALQRSLSQASR
jgi:serine/threonine protein kinase